MSSIISELHQEFRFDTPHSLATQPTRTRSSSLVNAKISPQRARNFGLAGLELAAHTWKEAVSSFDWDPQAVDTYVVHQVSKVHTRAVCDTLGLDTDRFPLIYPEFGNIGPAGVPTVLSRSVQDGTISNGDRVMLMGVGSGINAAAAEIIW